MFYTGDPVYDAELHEEQRERYLCRFPRCAHCGEYITERKLFDLDGNLYHLDCAEMEFQKDTEDYID